LRSGATVSRALEEAGHIVAFYDPQLDTDGQNLQHAASEADVAFPVLHGTGGEDGTLQARLDLLQMPYVGASADVSAQCFDKWLTLQKVANAGIVTPASALVSLTELPHHPLIRQPFVLKPRAEGSSIDTFLVRQPHEFVADDPRLVDAFERQGNMIMEPLIVGTELTVAILEDESLPVVEIIPPADSDFDYENKYNGRTQELCPPQHIPAERQAEAQAIALTVHRLMGCRDLSRSDFMLDEKDQLYFLEINTLPGMTEQSLFPRAAQAAGISMSQLVDRLVRAATARSL
jgi:D-alanine-D-alanine ligase